MKSVRLVAALACLSISLGDITVQAAESDEFPNRPLRYIVPFPPGGSTDIVARIMHLVAHQSSHSWPAALVGDVNDFDSRPHLEHFHRQLGRGADAGRRVVQLAGH